MPKRTPKTDDAVIVVNGQAPLPPLGAAVSAAVGLRIVSLTATFLVRPDWRLESETAHIRRLVKKLNEGGCLQDYNLVFTDSATGNLQRSRCTTCGWIHDGDFTQIRLPGGEAISLGGVLPDIVGVVHRAHEKGLPGVSTKGDAALERVCGGYKHPCKAFHGLKRQHEYRLLFEIRRRGTISLRGAVGRIRNKSESISE